MQEVCSKLADKLQTRLLDKEYFQRKYNDIFPIVRQRIRYQEQQFLAPEILRGFNNCKNELKIAEYAEKIIPILRNVPEGKGELPEEVWEGLNFISDYILSLKLEHKSETLGYIEELRCIRVRALLAH